jgi:4-diphosphocytidyl-2-C-methyl-D-erythritol kinase
MILFPNAKINIGLDILAKRPDGYHNIETVMYPVPWSDILEIVPARGTSTTLTTTGRPVECPPEKNLVMKAYRALNEFVELPPVDIYLHKVIPDGAGLGGGSSDAAFTLKALNNMFSLGLTDSQLADIAASLGADCPFFIYNSPMLATGTGTTLTPFPMSLSGHSIAIVKPDVSVPTAAAYAGVRPHTPEVELSHALKECDCRKWRGLVKNDFEQSIFPSHPVIADIKHTLYNIGAEYAAMSGSGSSVFGIFDRDADILAEDVRSAINNHDIFTATLD